MSARIEVVTGPNQGQMFALAEGAKVAIGRADTADLRITDPGVSRTHCVIECVGGKCLLKDAGSSSGTRVNGKAIATHVLQAGETIGIGGTLLRFIAAATAKLNASASSHLVPGEPELPETMRTLPGTKLGHFHVGQPLAVGNSGVVFRAQDFKDKRDVALKVYLPEFSQNGEDLQRFIRAVKTMLPMRHPNLVTLFGGGKTGPYCWMAMELIEGESLSNTIARIGQQGKLDWRPALNVAISLASGLYYLHGEQIIHRNLSPGNILFTRQGVAKLGSLILAKALSGALATDVTVGGEFLGDVRYMAPEQVGTKGPVDARADIYSLGTLVYAMLTGKPPFEAKNPLETATMIVQRPPISPRQVNPHIPNSLEAIVLTMLAKKPVDRIQSAGDLLTELEQLPPV